MKRIVLSLYLVCSVVTQSKQPLLRLKEDFLQQDALKNSVHGRTVHKAFFAVDKLYSLRSKFSEYIRCSDVQQLFQIVSHDDTVIEQAQLLLLVQLYDIFFTLYMHHAHMLLQEVVRTKQYWQYELAIERLPRKNKHPSYWMHESTHQSKVHKKIVLLESIEKQLANLIGMVFFGHFYNNKIDNIDNLYQVLQKSMYPLYKFFDKKQSAQAADLYNDMSLMYGGMISKQKVIAKILQVYAVPHHVKRHWCLYSSVSITTGLLLLFCLERYKDVPMYTKKVQHAGTNFVSEYIMNPLYGLKRAVWDYSEESIPRIEIHNDIVSCISTGSFGMRTAVNVIKYALNEELRLINDGISEIIKRQQINYYLSSIMPILSAAYGCYCYCRYLYKHESCFKPIRMTLRDIDIQLNKAIGGGEKKKFESFGRLYFLVQQLRFYNPYLSSEDFLLLDYDIKELLSLDLTYEQKQKVVERMYRTYDFLK